MHGVKINPATATNAITYICEDPHALTESLAEAQRAPRDSVETEGRPSLSSFAISAPLREMNHGQQNVWMAGSRPHRRGARRCPPRRQPAHCQVHRPPPYGRATPQLP